MPIDKQLHSEYRSTYTWHEYTGPHQEHTVVRRAPQPPPTSTKQASAKLQSAKSTEDENSEGPTLEPPLPRRKKCPELAYKTHEFITAADGGGIDAVDSNLVADKVREVATLPPSQLSKAISRISTEYRLQFAWPRRPQLTNGEAMAPVTAAGAPAGTAGPPRKSLSMGALKQGIAPTGPAPVHKKRPGDVDPKRDGVQASELEPLVGGPGIEAIDGTVPEGDEREEEMPPDLKTIPFGRSVTKEEKEKENTRKVAPIPGPGVLPAGRPSSVLARPVHGILQEDAKTDNERAIARARKDFLIRHHLDRTTGGVGDGALLPSPTREKLEPVIPRRRDEAKEHREEIQPKTKSSPKNSPRTGRSQSLGPSVTERRSPKRQPARAPSLTKDAKEKEKEKDKEQKEKGVEPERHSRPSNRPPLLASSGQTSEARLADTLAAREPRSSPVLPPVERRASADLPPTHPHPPTWSLDSARVIGQDRRRAFPSAIIPLGRPRNLPKDQSPSSASPPPPAPDAARAHPSPHLASLRISRSRKGTSSRLISGVAAGVSVTGPGRVRWSIREPSTVSSTVSPAGLSTCVPPMPPIPPLPPPPSGPRAAPLRRRPPQVHRKLTAEPQLNGEIVGGDSSVASTPPSQSQPSPPPPPPPPAVPVSPSPTIGHAAPTAPIGSTAPTAPTAPIAASPWLDDEPVVKSPPEPTRVKSPEQMIMRSPEPVNWTVPLDTGKTFTVTQNVREEPLTRPHSEAKTWAPSSIPSAPQSAPPELAAQHKSHHSQHSGYKSPESESVSLGSFTGLNGHKDLDSERDSPLPTGAQDIGASAQIDQTDEELPDVPSEPSSQRASEPSIKPIVGTNLRCLEDPVFEFERKKEAGGPPSSTTTTTTLTTTTTTTTTTTMTTTTTTSTTAAAVAAAAAAAAAATPTAGGQQGYRVLEAEAASGQGEGGGGESTAGGAMSGVGGLGSSGSGYHVLEAPAPIVPGSAQRLTASDVLEKARNRFDKFWGKGGGPEN
ncbi:hypothetical protein KM043_000437 [Ampulex compressa]|nr:hypothetical protein KM043_000437 [Ampulex compressa]